MDNDITDRLIPSHIRQLKGYVAGKTIAEVAETYKPEQISKLASNENRLGCSPRVHPAVMEAMREIQDYPDPIARKLRAALSKKNGVSENEILIAAGSESILSILCRTFLEPGDEIVTVDATFVGIFVQAGVMNATLRKVPLHDDFSYNGLAMAEQIGDKTKLVYLANPNNPTGTYIPKEEFEAFIDAVPEHVVIVVDEAYYEYARDVVDFPHAVSYRRKNMMVLRTFSKAYGLAGFRIGYAIAHPEWITQMMKTKLTFEPTAPAQAAALAALEDEDFLQESVQLVKRERAKLAHFLDDQGISYVPSIANSLLLQFASEEEAGTFTQEMLKKGVILRQTTAFGLPDCVRVSIGTDGEMQHFRKCCMNVLTEILS
ncbi:MAG: histidinol-phosphate transaminase [Balneolaceae bacterium]